MAKGLETPLQHPGYSFESRGTAKSSRSDAHTDWGACVRLAMSHKTRARARAASEPPSPSIMPAGWHWSCNGLPCLPETLVRVSMSESEGRTGKSPSLAPPRVPALCVLCPEGLSVQRSGTDLPLGASKAMQPSQLSTLIEPSHFLRTASCSVDRSLLLTPGEGAPQTVPPPC